VYVSSTIVDLKDHRAELKLALLEGAVRRGVHVDILGLRGTAPGHVPGYWPTEANPVRRSITKLECEEACRNSINPRLVFTIDPDHPWMKKWIVDGLSEVGYTLAASRDEVETRHGRAMLSDPDQLARLVFQALSAREERAFSPASRTYPPPISPLGWNATTRPWSGLFLPSCDTGVSGFCEFEGQVYLEMLIK
jgi:hypothetical protein